MRNHPAFVEAMVGASITGAVFVPIDPRAADDRLAFMLRLDVLAATTVLVALALWLASRFRHRKL